MKYPSLFCILVVLMTGSAAAKTNTELDRRTETLRKMDAIERAMNAFALTYGRVPCPADSTLTVADANFGKELLSGIDCGSDVGQAVGEVMAGSVPVRALSLPDTLMFDGWGRRIAYVVDQRFAGKGTFQQDLTNADITLTSYNFTANSGIEVRDTVGGNILNGAANDRTIGVLLSYGQNGRGAFTRQGVRLDSGVDADELENSHYQGGGAFNTLFIKKKSTASFDDIVRIVNRNANVPLHCLGVDVPSRTGGHTVAGGGYPAYDWPNAVAGTTETQACSAEYTGTVTRECDANGQWQPIVSTCNCDAALLTDGASYSGTWPKGDDINTVIGDTHTLTEADDNVCLPGFYGDVTAECQAAGGWGVTVNNCSDVTF